MHKRQSDVWTRGFSRVSSGMRTRLKPRVLPPVIACLFLIYCGGKAKEAEAENESPATVLVEAARRGPIDHIVTADAVLYPINQANVTPKISAPVRRVLVNRGDHVRAGQLLAELESRDLT